jgi:ribosomal protein S2
MQDGDTLTRLVREVAIAGEIEAVDPDVPLNDLGIDSMKLIVALINFYRCLEGAIEIDRLVIDNDTTLRSIDLMVKQELARTNSQHLLLAQG